MRSPGSECPARERTWSRALALLAWLLVTATAGCEDELSPTAVGSVEYSVFGYLDPSADTQWVRVTPLRPRLSTSAEPSLVEVTVEDLGTGERIELRDSVFRYPPSPGSGVDSDGVYLPNFWTTAPIRSGASYRFSASVEGGASAEAVIRIPADYTVEVGVSQRPAAVADYLRLTGTVQVPFITAAAHFTDGCGAGVDSVWVVDADAPAAPFETGTGHRIPIHRWDVPPREGCGRSRVLGRDLWVVASRSEWPSGEGHAAWSLGAPERASNVSNAVGFLGGVLTKEFPYETCDLEVVAGASTPDHCWLRYDAESVRLSGRVVESRCGDGPIDSVTVQVRELEPWPPTVRTVRTVETDPTGAFEIGALEPGAWYAISARAKPWVVPGSPPVEIGLYTEHSDTAVFEPGEVVAYPIELRRLTPCEQAP